VYFNGTWVISFDKNATRKGNFKTDDGRIIETPMMESVGRESRFNYTETGDMQILELPYQGKRISMIILLPKNDISSLEKSLTAGRLAGLTKGLQDGVETLPCLGNRPRQTNQSSSVLFRATV
jgi:serpin B